MSGVRRRPGSGMQFSPGTRFYAPSPPDGRGFGRSRASKPRLDVWVDGKGFPQRASHRCMDRITGTVKVTRNPGHGLP
jgi:hypothetical protein